MPEGELVNVSTVIVFAPDVTVVDVEGRVIAYVAEPLPVTVKVAAAIVPAGEGRVTPPVVVLVGDAPAGRTTVPDVPLDATLPKFISAVFVMAIGVKIVPVAVAVAEL